MSASEADIKAFFKTTKADWSKNWANMVEEEATNDLFTFKPSEFTIVEELEYDETIQRPEAIRFYTLDEQVGDAYEKMVPRGRTTKFQMEVLRKEADRLRQLYLDHIVPTADTYLLREAEYGKRFSWINPVYAPYGEEERATYSFARSWIPLFDEAHVRLPNFYRTMLGAVPRPYKNVSDEGVAYPISEITEFVDSDGKNPSRALPTFQYTRTQRHEDGRADILDIPMANTADIVKFIGYYAKKRPVPIPNPLPEHDFLKSSDAVMIETTAPLSEVVPSLDAILTHAVPVTHDPYGEGMKYLRVYDVELSDIPWKSWKSRFPPAEMVVGKEPIKIEFPKSHEDAPSKKLMEYYQAYHPAMSTRQWLMDQVDGGELVVHMLMSQVGENGTVAMSPGADADFEYPKTTIKECELDGLDFHDFSIRGTLRRTWGAKDKITYQCIPLELIKQERKREGHRGRKQWMEKSHEVILGDYIKALVTSRPLQPKQVEPKYESKPAREVSHLRHEIVVVLNDSARLPEDKVRDITDLVKDAILEGSTYVDSKGLFLVCLHTLSILLGDLAEDRRKFYDNWTARVDGFRVCKFCGEHVNADVLEDQEEFSDEGRVIRHADALEKTTFSGHGPTEHIKTLAGLKDLFDVSLPSDEVFFMLISLLYVVPEVDQLLPIITMGRTLAAQLQKTKNINGGVVGIAQTILLIQSHIAPLVPRRSFGSKPLTLRGYPRDTDKSDGYTIVDSMMLVLSKTLEAYPTSFKGSSAITMRKVLSNPGETKKLVIACISALMKGSEPLRTALERAKAVLPAEEPTKPSTMIPGTLVMPSGDSFGRIQGPPACPTSRVYWMNGREPNIKQPDVPLRKGIDHFIREGSIRTKMIEKADSERVKPGTVSVKDAKVVARLKAGKEGASEDWHTNVLIATRLASAFASPVPIRTLDPAQKSDELRDITKGYVYELLNEIGKDPLKKTKLDAMKKDDLAYVMLTADVKKAAVVTNSLKAKERITYTERLRLMTDADREITKDLIDRGLAPYIISRQDRILFAREVGAQEEADDEGVGVGRPPIEGEQELPADQDKFEDGNYGNYSGSNAASGNMFDAIEPNNFEEEDGQV